MFSLNKIKIKTFFIISIFLFPVFAFAININDEVVFNIDKSYDINKREEIKAILIKSTDNLYFFVDKNLWDDFDTSDQKTFKKSLSDIDKEFKEKIYPILTSKLGSESNPGIDNDKKITILIHPMKKGAGAYSRLGDLYSKFEYPLSNEKEMIYLNSDYINNASVKTFLAHEFTHLITLNQKNLERNIEEDIWLNEARAEYAITLLGYDDNYPESNLERRVNTFLKNPSVSLTEWEDSPSNYAVVNLFTQYLVDHYGVKILKDSLKSEKVGIDSINEALSKNEYKENFSQIFADWAITVLLNDCSLGEKYCYKNKNLKDLRINPVSNYLPLGFETSLSVKNTLKGWQPSWYKIFGGGGTLTFEFDGKDNVKFNVPYVLCDNLNKCSVNHLILDEYQKDEITVSGFNAKYKSLYILPFVEEKGDNFSFSIKMSIDLKGEDQIKDMLNQIELLKKEIERLKAEIAKKNSGETISNENNQQNQNKISCQKINNNLYFGLLNNNEVSCLQEFLKNEGVYPEGLITGNFLSLTYKAVINFQEKYSNEILLPFNLEKGTGYVGEKTREKINQIIENKYK